MRPRGTLTESDQLSADRCCQPSALATPIGQETPVPASLCCHVTHPGSDGWSGAESLGALAR